MTNCKNCGAPLVNGKCVYCKTNYNNSGEITLHQNLEFIPHDAEFLRLLTEASIFTRNEAERIRGINSKLDDLEKRIWKD